MQKIKECIVCSGEIVIKLRSKGNARKTCSIKCREKLYKEKLMAWLNKNSDKMKKYHREYSKTRVRDKASISPWAPMHSYDVLSD